MRDSAFRRIMIFCNAVVPLALLSWDWSQDKLGANPPEFINHTTGTMALIFLTLTVAVTPIKRLTSLNWLIAHRRMLGLFAFFYAVLHLISYVCFDQMCNWITIALDILSRPFIAVGMLAFLSMIPLAVTSSNRIIKQLGIARWQALHKLTYFSAIAAVVHYYMLVKSDATLPLIFGCVLLVLLGFRLKLPMATKSRDDNGPSRGHD